MKYYCEKCGKVFDSEDKCLECENKHIEEEQRKNKLKEEKSQRWNEVQLAYKNASDLLEKYYNDYGESHNSKMHTSPLSLFDIFDIL